MNLAAPTLAGGDAPPGDAPPGDAPPERHPSSAARRRAACLYLDIVGFSSTMDQLESDRGADGIEDLLEALNACFGSVTAAIGAFGGEVASLIGDGLIAIWPVTAGPSGAALSAARACAHAIAARGPASSLPVRIAVGEGEVFTADLRGSFGRDYRLVAGPLIATLAAACGRARPGEVLLAAATPPADPSAGAPPAAAPEPPPAVSVAAQDAWLPALRVATILFARLDGVACGAWADFERVGAAATTLDRLARMHGGLLEKIHADEKGFVALMTFGMPPRVGSYRPEQAFAAATAIRTALDAVGIGADIGIGTGRVFRGPVDRGGRPDFATHGNAAHRAVRLMTQAERRILCDQPTHAATIASLSFDPLPALRLRGFAAPVPAFALATHDAASAGLGIARTALIGRAAETGRIDERLARVARGDACAMALLAEAGLGKTALLQWVRETARQRGIDVLTGAGSPLTTAMPYHAWRGVFQTILGLSGDKPFPGPPPDAAGRVLSHLADLPNGLALAPLLEAVLPGLIAENATTRAMSERGRAEARADLLLRLILRHQRERPLLIIFDDGHWLDDASVRLLADPRLAAAGVSVLVGCRPEEGATRSLLDLLATSRPFEPLRLGALDRADSARLIAGILAVRQLAPPVVDWIWRAAQGHPLFSAELARLLQDRGLLATDGHTAALTVAPDAPELQSLPGSVEAVLTDRLDRMELSEQLVFRSASVIGEDFDLGLLEAVHPHPPTRRLVGPAVSRLLEAGLFTAGGGPGPRPLAFAHPTFRGICYAQIPREQRRGLHLAVARVLESVAELDPRSTSVVLAYHYRRARLHDEALRCIERASDYALRDGAYRTALDLLEDAAAIHRADGHFAAHGTLPAYECDSRLARACLGLGQLDQAGVFAARALAGIGYRWPAGRPGLWAGLAMAVATDIADGLRRPRAWDGQGTARLQVGVAAATILMFVGFFRGQLALGLLACLRAVHYARVSGDRIAATHCYGGLVILAGLLRLEPLRRHLWRRQARNVRAGGPVELRVHAVTGWLHHINFCRWEEAERSLAAHPSVIGGSDDPHLRNNEIAVEAFVLYVRGDLAAAEARYASLRPLAEKQRNPQHLVWSYMGVAFCRLAQGRYAEVIPLAEAARAQLSEQTGSMEPLVCDGPLAVACLRTGELARAEAVGIALLARLRAQSLNVLGAFEGYAGAVEVWLGLAELRPAEARRYLRLARQAIRRLRMYASMYAVGLPRYWLYRGFLALRAGSAGTARRRWSRALRLAMRHDMPLEAARARAVLAAARPALLALSPAHAHAHVIDGASG